MKQPWLWNNAVHRVQAAILAHVLFRAVGPSCEPPADRFSYGLLYGATSFRHTLSCPCRAGKAPS